jgi:hypothetical protein
MNIERINSAARDIIARNPRITTMTRDARLRLIDAYCDDPSTTRTDMLRILTRIELTIDFN